MGKIAVAMVRENTEFAQSYIVQAKTTFLLLRFVLIDCNVYKTTKNKRADASKLSITYKHRLAILKEFKLVEG